MEFNGKTIAVESMNLTYDDNAPCIKPKTFSRLNWHWIKKDHIGTWSM